MFPNERKMDTAKLITALQKNTTQLISDVFPAYLFWARMVFLQVVEASDMDLCNTPKEHR